MENCYTQSGMYAHSHMHHRGPILQGGTRRFGLASALLDGEASVGLPHCVGVCRAGTQPQGSPMPLHVLEQYLHSAATPGTQVLLHFSNCTPPFFFFSLNDCAERLFSLKLYFFCSHSVKWIPLCLFYTSLHSSRD